MKELLSGEREAVRTGEDRQTYITKRERITALARKRGRKQPRVGSKSSVSRLHREKTKRRGGCNTRKKGVKELRRLGLPSVVARTAP